MNGFTLSIYIEREIFLFLVLVKKCSWSTLERSSHACRKKISLFSDRFAFHGLLTFFTWMIQMLCHEFTLDGCYRIYMGETSWIFQSEKKLTIRYHNSSDERIMYSPLTNYEHISNEAFLWCLVSFSAEFAPQPFIISVNKAFVIYTAVCLHSACWNFMSERYLKCGNSQQIQKLSEGHHQLCTQLVTGLGNPEVFA